MDETIRLLRLIQGEMFLTVTETARRLKVSRSTVYRLMESGDLAYIQLGGVRRIPIDSLLALYASAFDDSEEGPDGDAALQEEEEEWQTIEVG